jgi:hypothetical protein
MRDCGEEAMIGLDLILGPIPEEVCTGIICPVVQQG